MIDNVIHAAEATATAGHAVTMWGTVPAWLSAFFGGGSVIGIAKLVQIWRAGEVAKKVADDAGDAGIRTHYATELAALREQISKMGVAHAEAQRLADERYNAGMRAADEREEHCQRQVSELRAQVDLLHDVVAGLRRNSIQTTHSALYLATQPVPDDIDDITARSSAAIERKQNGDRLD